MRTRTWLPGLVLLGAAIPPAATGDQPAPRPSPPLRAVQGGIAVELELLPVGDAAPLREGDATVRFRLSDAVGQPLAGAYPAAWLDLLGRGEGSTPALCVEKVEEFLGGSLFNRPAVDLNSYYVLALNQDATITVVDPLFGYGGSKLLALVELPGPGHDWALGRDGRRLFVSVPGADRLEVVETSSWKRLDSVRVAPRPGRLALSPDGSAVWVALDGDEGGVAVVATGDLRLLAQVPTGRGPHDLAFSDDGRHVFVTNRGEGTVSVVDATRLAKRRDVPAGGRPVSVAFSSRAGAAYVTSEETGTVTVVPAAEGTAVARIQAEPGLGAIRFAPDGRLAFVVNPERNRLYVLDASTNRILQRADMDYGPDQVTFSPELAYVRQRRTDTVLMIPLDLVGQEGEPVPVVDFTGGQNPLGKVSSHSPADSIVRAPGATAVLVANPADRMIYYYKEGMAAPMGSFVNYGREPRAVLVVDRSLREREPGRYETVARLPQPGRYRVAFFLDAPRTVHCFEVEVAADPELAAQRLRDQPVRVEARIGTEELEPGRNASLRFRLTDPASGEPRVGVSDLQVLIYLSAGTWHQRQWARGLGDGLYEVGFVPPAGGAYRVAVESLSQRLPFHGSPPVVLHVAERPAARP